MCNITKQNLFQNLFLILVILVSLSVLSSCNEKEKNVASTIETCPEKTIRVELGGHILELEREKVRVSKSVANSAQSLDLSKDCSISIARNPDSVTVYDDMDRFTIKVPEQGQKSGSFFQHKYLFDFFHKIDKADQKNIERYGKGNSVSYFLRQTEGYEKNGNPIRFSCPSERAPYGYCFTSYIHPSGLLISYGFIENFPSIDIYEKMSEWHEKIDKLFITNTQKEEN